jgi:hypothetical protein
VFDEGCTYGSGSPRATAQVHPHEVHDAKEVHEERETGYEPYHAMGRWSFDVRGKVNETNTNGLGVSALLTVFRFPEGISLRRR